MNLNKLKPWNWFKNEDNGGGGNVPVPRGAHPLSALQTEMDRVFDSFYRSFGGSMDFPDFGKLEKSLIRPVVDISEKKDQYRIKVEIPGVDKDDIHLRIEDDNTLVVSGEKKMEKDEKDGDFHCIETSYGSFQRLISLPADADHSGLKASFRNGVLTLSLPKLPESSSSARTIPIS